MLLFPSEVMHSTAVGAPSCSAVCTGPAVCVAQLPTWPVPKSRNARQLYGTYQVLNGRMDAAPIQRSQSRVAGTAASGGGCCSPVGAVPGVVEMWASVTSPMAPDQIISAATRL